MTAPVAAPVLCTLPCMLAPPLLMAVGLALGFAAGPAPASAAARDELDELDALFDDFYAWFGRMYDPATGGVFYSAAAQARPDEYPPHIESTSKFVNVLDWSGRLDALPLVMRDATVAYIRAKQLGPPDYPATHPLHGFFMHPADPRLDPDNPNAQRRDYAAARATGMSVGLLRHLGSEPRYPLPGTGDDPRALPHLASGDAFAAWLNDRKWDRTWTAGGDLLTQSGHILRLPPDRQAELLAAARPILDAMQDPATGQWGLRDENGRWVGDNTRPYHLLNGAHKIVAFYAEFDRPVPHADRLMAATLDEIATRPASNMLYVYNASQLVRNLRDVYGVPLTDPQRDAFVRQAAARLAPFRQPDGGFTKRLVGHDGNVFEPAIPGPASNTDASGLALKTRDNLHVLVHGHAAPLGSAADPRLFQAAARMGE